MHSLATRTCSVYPLPICTIEVIHPYPLPVYTCPSVPLLMCPLLSRVPLISSSVLPRPKSYEFPTSKSLHYCPLDRYVSSSQLPPSQYSCSFPDTTLYHVSFFICLPALLCSLFITVVHIVQCPSERQISDPNLLCGSLTLQITIVFIRGQQYISGW